MPCVRDIPGVVTRRCGGYLASKRGAHLNGWSSPQMLARYGASARSARARSARARSARARSARARRTYDRIMTGNP